MINAINSFIKKFFFIIALLLLSISSLSNIVFAEENSKINTSIKEINSFEDFFIFAQASKGYDYANVKVVLNTDIVIDSINQAMLDKYGIKHLTVGSKDMPFRGTFDGQGHTIKGLKYDAGIIKDANTGLFSFIENATVENLIVEDAILDCAFQGGMIVGYANNSTLRNITVLNSKLHITTANNVLSLITNGGFSGGGIAGIIENTLMYNCEVSGTEVVNNSTAGVTGVGGEGLYMGALIGWAKDSTIEYCRARANYAGESEKELRNTTVRNDYDIAVGALGGKSVYAGGIVGGVNGKTEIIDCFSTADVSFDVRNYVAVGSGIAGYAGGITAALRGESKIERCHFAGDIKSYQYNAVLVVPIIQHNVNINGITRIFENSSVVNNSYFKPSVIKSGVTIPAVEDSNTESYCPQDDDTYVNIDFWESKGYDFIGTESRFSNKYPEEHINKWVMDEDLGIPVHGSSIMATFDFPSAGLVSIRPSALIHKESITDDPLNFAIQGIHPREMQETTITLKLNNADEANPDYRIVSWHKIPNVSTHEIDSVKKIHDKINDQTKIGGTEGLLEITQSINDRDLFIADIEAKVEFYDVDGNPFDNHTYWHKYETPLTSVTPPKLNESIFFGWTTMGKLNDQQKMIGYSSISSTELNDIIQAGELYKAGDLVEKPLKLYPIYINSLANVITEFEGHEQDAIDDKTKREGVGYTEVLVNDNDEVIIKALAEDGTINFPDGYEFKGWYQRFDDGSEYRVSENTEYIVPDTSKQVTYIAKFEYKVDYMVKAFLGDSGGTFKEPELYTTRYYSFNEPFENIKGPEFVLESVINWGLDKSVDHSNREECNDNFNGSIVKPLTVYSHNLVSGSSTANNYTIRMRNDFPNSGFFASKYDGNGNFEYTFTPTSDRYHLQFWTLENLDKKKGWSYSDNPMLTGHLDIFDPYEGYALVSADVNFHKNEQEIKTVQRRYDDPIFRNENYSHNYIYPITQTQVDTNTYEGNEISGKLNEEKSYLNSEMQKSGYEFLGWVSKNDITVNECNYIFDTGEWGVTSNPDKARAYLLNPDWVDINTLPNKYKVKETMDLYPVYAKYQITTTTNIENATNLPEGVNKPSIPSYQISASDKYGMANITVVAENDKTAVINDNPKNYQLVSLLCEVDGKTQKLAITKNNDGNYEYSGEIIAGKSYKYTAIYSPAFVKYHLNEADKTEVVIKDIGSNLGITLLPDFANITDVVDAYFAGWTTEIPDNGVIWKFNSKQDYDQKTLELVSKNTVVKNTMDLYPVFVNANLIVNSNIDEIIKANNENPLDYRNLSRGKDGTLQLNINPYPGYSFVGWYEGEQELTKDQIKNLSIDELFSDRTFTAKFEKAHLVRYFDADGNEVYSINVVNNSRSFVEHQTVGTEQVEVMIDNDAFVKLYSKLQSNEIFYEWEWAYTDNAGNNVKKPWSQFKDIKITQDMNLYPKLAIVNAKSSNDIDITDKLEYHMTSANNDMGSELTSILKDVYHEPNLTLVINERLWDEKQSMMVTKHIQNLATRVYIKKTSASGNNEIEYKEASNGPIYTNSEGLALHEFNARIIINKIYDDNNINRNIFINIVNSKNESLTIPLEVVDGVGKLALTLPIGDYVINEDANWIWRDEAITNITNPITLNIGDEVTVNIKNNQVDNKWFSDEIRSKNIFK